MRTWTDLAVKMELTRSTRHKYDTVKIVWVCVLKCSNDIREPLDIICPIFVPKHHTVSQRADYGLSELNNKLFCHTAYD